MLNIIETNLQFNGNKTIRDLSTIKRIILHHSGVSVLQTVETIHNYHKNSRGYAGIGYHFYVRKDGNIYRGRPLEYVGAHAYNHNADSIGICAEGDFNLETMSDVQKNAIMELVEYLRGVYNISSVQGHKEVCATSCPGANFPLSEIVNGTITKNETVQTTKSIDEIAQEVINGKYGVGEARKQSLGSLYNEVQAKVNEILLGKKTTVAKKSNEEIANEVIAGKWGNGQDRKAKLATAGYDYNAIQKIVNQKLR